MAELLPRAVHFHVICERNNIFLMVDEIVRNGGDVYIGYFPGKFSYVANAFKLSRFKCHKLRAASTYITLTHVEISEETTLIYLMTR